ncbi:MAPEG family protein [Shewanella sp. NIFS-20-20]|uniref:MAPEG family protein n=1 Tax=Shewanella sp. NIFS-20-20 TaxID=2853806 RepID=UPI001C493828|nr:MAPEG family protein [Shewanella sp. NIFS-20-20]MBV7315648.1 MAPEG family protein [Shewanella sp. NIFS-20-20]
MLLITGLFGAFTGLFILILTYRVVRVRRSQKIGIGSGGNAQLALARRVHENLLENAPIFLILLACAEINQGSAAALYVIGLVWMVARLLHALGLTLGQGGYHPGRFYGVLLTWLVITALCLLNLWQYLKFALA